MCRGSTSQPGAGRRIAGIACYCRKLSRSESQPEFFGITNCACNLLKEILVNARRYYNATVRDYNTAIQQFPGVIVANMTGFKAREFYELDNEQEAQNVEVKF